MHPFKVQYTPEVKHAMDAGHPLVALESTVIAHGLPYPENIETARLMEDAVRESGAVPVTLAILDGVVHAGVTDAQMERLAKDSSVHKLSSRDIAATIALKKSGATTVSATMMLAHKLGIRIFATGGIGGVHRGAEADFDISADLEELARTPVLVVCSGVKSILDIPKTLEYLETRGVPVIGYKTEIFPAFFTTNSGMHAPLSLLNAVDVANVVNTHFSFRRGGAVLAQSVPVECDIPAEDVEFWIQNALLQAKKDGIHGKEVTPYLLRTLKELSQGATLTANKALLISNARLAGQIAVALEERGTYPMTLSSLA